MLRAYILLIAIVFATPAWAAGEAATADMNILRDTIRANKKALVAASLTLTDDEAGRFWPIYDRYEAARKAVNDRLVALIEDYTSHYKDLTDEHAKKLAEDYLAVEEDRAKVRREYFAEFVKAVPGKKAARFYQIENKMDAVIRYDLAGAIPVMEQ
jgi:hypothetical protein